MSRTPLRSRVAMHALGSLFVASVAASAGLARPPADAPIVEPPFTALADDAARYAARYGVGQGEAEARLRAQGALGDLVDHLRAAYGDRLAGIALEHRPRFRLVVLLAGGEPVPERIAMLAGLAVPVAYRTDAVATIATVRAAIVAHQAEIRATLRDPPGLGVDPRAGALLVSVGTRDAEAAGVEELRRRFAGMTGVPVEIAVPGLADDLALAGGGRLDAIDPALHRRYACTAGFVVTDGERVGISTAAHCPDDLGAGGVPLTLIGAWGAGTQDVQIHAAAVPLMPAFRVGTGDVVRPVTGMGTRERTVAGQFVCHQGFRDGESCAEVIATDYAPPGDLCAGPCPPDWVAVAGPDCRHGDSGGPVFDGTVALGLLKAASTRPDGRCGMYYYMPIEALPRGWTVLTAAPSPPPPAYP